MSKIESGKLALLSEPIDVVEVMSATLQHFTVYTAKKNVEFSYGFDPPQMPMLVLDKVRMRQVVFNLVRCVYFGGCGLIPQRESEGKKCFVFNSSG